MVSSFSTLFVVAALLAGQTTAIKTCPAGKTRLCCFDITSWSAIKSYYENNLCFLDEFPYVNLSTRIGERCANYGDSECAPLMLETCCTGFKRANSGACALGLDCVDFPKAPIPTGWTPVYGTTGGIQYGNCFKDTPTRIIKDVITTIDNTGLTPTSCLNSCKAAGFLYGGVEAGNECHCGKSFAPPAFPAISTDCDIPCTGDSKYECGGSWRIQIWKYTG